MTQNFLVHIIGDYCDDNAFDRVKQKLREMLLKANISFENMQFEESWVPQFDTRATGFCLAELARNSHLPKYNIRHIFYVNTAPRKDDVAGRHDNAGEKMVYLKLVNGVEILAVNSGGSLAFLNDVIEEARHLDISDRGSQFRSLNVFPEALERLATNDQTLFKEDASSDLPSPVNPYSINFVDGYGNIKTNIKSTEFDDSLFGTKAILTIGDKRHGLTISRKLFEDAEGVGLILYRGSSGWDEKGREVNFMEIGLRGGSAARHIDADIENGTNFSIDGY